MPRVHHIVLGTSTQSMVYFWIGWRVLLLITRFSLVKNHAKKKKNQKTNFKCNIHQIQFFTCHCSITTWQLLSHICQVFLIMSYFFKNKPPQWTSSRNISFSSPIIWTTNIQTSRVWHSVVLLFHSVILIGHTVILFTLRKST